MPKFFVIDGQKSRFSGSNSSLRAGDRGNPIGVLQRVPLGKVHRQPVVKLAGRVVELAVGVQAVNVGLGVVAFEIGLDE